jgi:hypothetical protein
MAAPSGIAGQIGLKSETSWGLAVTVDTFHPGLVSEAVKKNVTRIDSKGIRAGRRVNHTWKAGAHTIEGPVNLEVFNIPQATLLTHMFGTVTSTNGGSGTIYTHTAVMGSLTGVSFTMQVGRPDIAGTVQPFTYAGCKLAGWTLACSAGEIPTLTLDITAKTEVTATSLASASYSSSARPFVFTEGALSIAGASVATVDSFSLACAMGLATTRHKIGSAAVAQQLESGMREVTGTIATDFESLTAYNRFVDAGEAALVLSFTESAASTNSFTITMNVRFDGETPALSGIETLKQNLPFKVTSTTSDTAAITAVLINTETSAA